MKRRNVLLRGAVFCGLLFMICGVSIAQTGTTVEIIASADTQIDESNPGTNFGTDHSLNIVNFSPYRARALYYFDLSSLPAGSNITSATLRLRLGGWGWAEPLKITGHRCLVSWNEGTATWNNFGNTPGSGGVAGSDYVSSAAFSRTFTASEGANGNAIFAEFNVLGTVQGWYTSPSTNKGFYLTHDQSTPAAVKYFMSRESWEGPTTYPRLIVTYTVTRTVDIVASSDTQIDESNPGTNFGTDHSLNIVNFSPYRARALYYFDLGGIPDGSVINSANLKLRLGGWGWAEPLKITGHRCLVSWSEGTATWNNFGNTPGSGGVAGSDYVSSAAFSRTFTASEGSNGNAIFANFTVTGTVQGWYATPSTNKGFYLTHDQTTPAAVKYFMSRESWEGPSTYPTLTVTSTGPDVSDTGTLSVSTSPVNGQVFVNSQSWGTAPVSDEIEVGAHTVSFGHVAGYLTPANQNVNVLKDQTTVVTAVYEPNTGTLSIDTSPVKGEVFVNSQSWGTAPVSNVVEAGSYTVSFGSVAGYVTPDNQNANVQKDQTTNVNAVYELETGTLEVDTNPVKGEVFVGGQSWGVAPVSDELVPGPYTVSFGNVAEYYTPDNQIANIQANQTTVITATYLPHTGTLEVDTSPVKGEVFVGGQSWGVAPVSDLIEIGSHTVSFGNVSGYLTPANQNVNVQKDLTTVVNAVYEPNTGTLSITTSPINAEVFVNSQSWGTAPASNVVEAGNYTVSFGNVLNYVTPAPQNVSVQKDQTTNVTGVYEVDAGMQVIIASADTQIDESNPTTNYGTHHSLNIVNFSPYRARALYYFDLSNIPAGRTITSATLRLRLGGWGWSEPLKVTGHRSLVSWNESTTTWNNFGNTPGSGGVAGSDYVSSAAFSRTFTASEGSNGNAIYAEFNVLGTVQGWFSNPSTNKGFYLTHDQTTPAAVKYFMSRESWEGPDTYPRLTVTYDQPHGVEYIHDVVPGVPWSIHILKIDRTSPSLQYMARLGQGKIQGLQTTSSQASAVSGAIGAINGDFYFTSGTYAGDPVGLNIWNGEMTSRSAPHPVTDGATFWIDTSGQPQINGITNQITVTWPNQTTTSIGINEMRNRTAGGWDNIPGVLFTPTFGTTTPTNTGREIVLEQVSGQPWLPFKPSQTYQAKVYSVHSSCGRTIPSNRMVLSLATGVGPTVNVGDVLQISTTFNKTMPTTTSLNLANVQTAIGGYPIVVFDSHNYGQYYGDQTRHPRTVVGYNSTHIYFVVVDGRQAGLSVGMSYNELATYMIGLGCTHSMNLDGGGSSTLWFEGQVKNSPSDGSERSVAEALIVFR